MALKFVLTKHVRLGNTRTLEITVTQPGDSEAIGVETFDFGMDVPLGQVRSEVMALLNEKYARNFQSLPGVGAEF